MGLYDDEFKDIDRHYQHVETTRLNPGMEDPYRPLIAECEKQQRSVRSELTGTGLFRLALVGLTLLALSGCTVHTHTWEGPPPQTVVYQPIVVQRPAYRPRRVVYTHHWQTQRSWRVPARPRRRGYRHR